MMMHNLREVVIGIDLGTQGARVLAVNPEGEVMASAHQTLGRVQFELPEGWFEQNPDDWWSAVCACIRQVVRDLPVGANIAGVSVASTSGTVLPVNEQGKPLHPAMMYNDRRSEPQCAAVQTAGKAHQARHGYKFGSSYALPKIAWFRETRPELFAITRRFLHAADFIIGRLSGEYIYSDTSNALKTGYDLIDLCWPDFIEHDLGISRSMLPEVVLPGQPVGKVSAEAAQETNLLQDTALFAGATDGTAAQMASGASHPGDWNTTLGTTLVIKGVTREMRLDPLGRVYFHRHPQGWWMPGGASNTGSDWIRLDYPDANLADLDRLAGLCVPSGILRYPLVKKGERFPFIDPKAAGFIVGEPSSKVELYAAGLEGVAMIERLAYETLESIGLDVGERIYMTGGGSRSPEWSHIRACVLNKTLIQPAVTETALGAAILAASGCWFESISQAVGAMVRVARTFDPYPVLLSKYEDQYRRFIGELKRRGYLNQAAA